MTNFDDLQALWNQQPKPNQPDASLAIIAKADLSHRQMIATHRGTMLILSITVLLLAVYFWVYGTTTIQPAFLASLLMMSSLIIRIGIEYISYRQFVGIKLTTDLRTCLERTRAFQKLRQRIQWVVTPVSLGCYVWGFILLLPYIKAGVSEGFYWYIISSGLVFLLVIGVIIYRQIRQEMRILAQLQESYVSLVND